MSLGAETKVRYTTVAVALHWLIAVAIILQILGGWRMEDLEGAAKFEAFQMHKSMGITILVLSLIRLGWRLANPPPPLPAHMKPWEKAAATTTHVLFYVLMIGIPIGGWIIISTSPYSVTTMIWGLIELPKLPLGDLPFTKALNEMAKGGHSVAAWGVIGLLGLHLGAVAKHAMVDRDDVPGRMIPGM